MSNTVYGILAVAIIALFTLLLRALPFLIFSRNEKTPGWLTYFGKVVPYAVMAMLLVYCYKSMDVTDYTSFAPMLIAGLFTALLQLWKKNSLVSIAAGTVLYMILVQNVFIS